MKNRSLVKDSLWLRLLFVFISIVIIFQFQRLVFVLYYHRLFEGVSLKDIFMAFISGFPMDCSVAGYLAVIPGLAMIAAAICGRVGKIFLSIVCVYAGIVSLILSAVFVGDIALYDFWNFRIDFTPVFYFLSSPKEAMASVSLWFIFIGVVAFMGTAVLNFLILHSVMLRNVSNAEIGNRLLSAVVLFLMTAALVLPIRGLELTPMNPSKAYFSDRQILNHTAVNPDFNLLYSMSHQSGFENQYRFMEPEKAQSVFETMLDRPVSSGLPKLLKPEYYPSQERNASRPDIVIVILESFSTHLMKSMGGEDIAVNLDRIASEGLLFTDFYANGFRTDRALPAIISAFPSQPSTSIMSHLSKMEKLPSIPASLKENGYDIAYYYGGNADFTNLMAYLVSCGFEKVISDKDFPASQLTGKWGANDGALFDRFLSDYMTENIDSPRFRIIQTSSSHDPFDVPDYNVLPDIKANSFSYTDMCIGKFIDRFSSSPQWDNTIVIMVPDHWAAYPDIETLDIRQRHTIPLVMTGGALAMKGRDSTVSSQIDIAATLLYQLGISHEEFVFSKNIFNPDSPHFAYISRPSTVGIVTEDNVTVIDCDADTVIMDEGMVSGEMNREKAQAFIQKLYDSLDAL